MTKVTAIIPDRQYPLAEYVGAGVWRIWLQYSADRKSGTYLVLNIDGSITKKSVFESGKQGRVLKIASAV